MTPRKRWRVTVLPAGVFEQRVTSRQAAYEKVTDAKHAYWRGETTSREAHVEVDDGDGYGWSLHERVVFPTLGSAS